MDNTRLWSLLERSLRAAQKAGAAILDVYHSDFTVETKEDNSPLTEADKRSHSIITASLTGMAADYPVLSEEGKNIPYKERSAWEFFWLIDPLDGTREFISRNGEFTVNIALIHRSRPVLGVIYIPVQDICYFAAKGLGSFRLEGAGIKEFAGLHTHGGIPTDMDSFMSRALKLPLEDRSLKKDFTVVASRSHLSPETEEFIRKRGQEKGAMKFLSAGSSLKFCLVAEGRADVYPRFGPTMEWDTAAGQIIVEESGGNVYMSDRPEPLRYNKQNLLNPHFIVSRPDS